jgi:hypothetical protein
MIFRTPGRVDVEPPSVADSLRERATMSPRVWQVAVDDLEDEVVEILFPPGCSSRVVEIFFSELSAQPGNSPVQTAADLFDVSIHLLVWTYTLAF